MAGQLMTIADCVLTELPKNDDPRGSLSVIEGGRHVPFSIERLFYLYGVPEGAERGGHSLKICKQLLIPIAGSFDVVVDDGSEKKRFHLDRPWTGLYVPQMIWRELDNFSADAVCLAVASAMYDSQDYYTDYEEYRLAVSEGNHEA